MTQPSAAPAAQSPVPPWRALLDVALLHLRRWLASDFRQIRATEAERAHLARPPLAFPDPVVQDYLAWRRSMAWVALGFGVPGIIESFIDLLGTETGGESGLTGFATVFMLTMFASRAFLGFILVRCALGWDDPRGGRGRLRLGWAVALFVPVLLVQLPLADWVIAAPADAGTVEGAGQGAGEILPGVTQQSLTRDLFGIVFGLMGLIQALPGLTSLFPGAVRAGLLVKSLLPGRSMGAVVALALGPIYALLLLVLMTFVQQLGGSVLFFLGSMLVFSAPLLTFRPTWALVPAQSAAEAAPHLVQLRRLGRLAMGCGLGLVVLGLLTTKVFGKRLLGIGDSLMDPLDLLLFLSWFVAMYSTYTVVSADALLQAMRLADRVRDESLASAQFAADGAVLARLDGAVGLAAAPPAAAPPAAAPPGPGAPGR